MVMAIICIVLAVVFIIGGIVSFIQVPEKSKKGGTRSLIGSLVLSAALIFLGRLSWLDAKAPKPPTPVLVGQKGYLVESGGSVTVAVSKDVLNKVVAGSAGNSKAALQNLLNGGQLFTVPSHTPVLLLGTARALSGEDQVRILSGPHAGEKGWVSSEWLKR